MQMADDVFNDNFTISDIDDTDGMNYILIAIVVMSILCCILISAVFSFTKYLCADLGETSDSTNKQNILAVWRM